MRNKLAASFLCVALLVIVTNLLLDRVLLGADVLWRTLAVISADLLIGLSGAAIVARYLTRDVQALSEATGAVRQGNLSQRAPAHERDEIGQLGGAFNQMVRDLGSVVHSVRENAEALSHSAQRQSATAEEMNAATEEIASAAQSIARGAEHQADMVSRTSDATRNLAGSIVSIADKARVGAQLANEASAKAGDGTRFAREASARMDGIVHRIGAASETVVGFKDKALGINRSVDLITRVAQQTHLLAINATIEAARAGEHGRGFAVVADEVRRLAASTRDLAEEISGLADTINENAAGALESMESCSEFASEGREVVAAAGSALGDIVSSVGSTYEQVREISRLTEEQTQSSETLVRALEEIRRVTEQNAASTQSASAATEEQNASMQQLSSSAQDLAHRAEGLRELVAPFRLG